MGSVPYFTAQIIVDGTDLLDVVRTIEQPYADADSQPSLAGAYEGLPADVLREPGQYFLNVDCGGTPIYECVCRCEGCWSLLVRITVTRDLIVWSQFEQPHQPTWRYDRLGPFTFMRSRYERALRCAAAQIPF